MSIDRHRVDGMAEIGTCDRIHGNLLPTLAVEG